MKLVRALGSVGGLTLASRVLALVRDSLAARYLGAGFASDAFNVAFRLPNMFRALFAEGAFAAAFIPMFNQKAAGADGRSAAFYFAERALAVLFPILIVFTAIMLIAAWPITWVLAGGFSEQNPTPAQFDFAVMLSRITIPYLALISICSLLGGILNSLERYWANAAAPILLNIAMIVALFFFHGHDEYAAARAQAIAVTAGGAAQLLMLWLACRMAGVKLSLRLPKFDADIKELLNKILPATVGAGAAQINLLISTALVGALLPAGSITFLYYADRLNQLPLGVIGIGLGTILLPTISRLLANGQEREAMETQNRGIELALFLTLPAMVAFLVAGEPIIKGLFQFGRFTADDARMAGYALSAFSLGLPAYVLVKVLTPGYYARGDTKTPVRFAMISIAINIIGNLIMIPTLGHIGPPLATALSALVNILMLYVTLVRREHFHADAQLRRRLPRLAIAALIMGGGLYTGRALLNPYLDGDWVTRYMALGVLVGAGMALYLFACFLTGAFRIADVKSLLRRRRASDPVIEADG